MSDLPATPAANLYQGIRDILLPARTQVRQTVNTAMVQAYWQIGRLIVEDEQGGERRAEYGKRVLSDLSSRLTADFGKGVAPDNLRNFRQFSCVLPRKRFATQCVANCRGLISGC